MKGVFEHGTVLQWAIEITTVLIVLGLLCAFLRLIKGPSLADRVVSVDVITILAVAVAGIFAVSSNHQYYVDVAIALSLVAFLATVAFAWYVDRRTVQIEASKQGLDQEGED